MALVGYSHVEVEAVDPEAPRTIASAIGRVDKLNDRLDSARGQLQNLSDMIGGPRGLSASAKGGAAPTPTGAVYRLNESADRAHSTMIDIESLLSSIQRSLG